MEKSCENPNVQKEILSTNPPSNLSSNTNKETKANPYVAGASAHEYIEAKENSNLDFLVGKQNPNITNMIETRTSIYPYQKSGIFLGEGNFSKVYQVVNLESNEKLVFKEIKMEKFDRKKAYELIYGEISHLEHCKDVYLIVKLRDRFHYKNSLIMVL